MRLVALLVFVGLAAKAAAQCPNGTPPPCSGDTRQSAPMTLIKRAAPRALDDRTYIVLPFTNVSRAPDADWLSDAAVNMLSMDLARWQDIKVIDDRRVADYLRESKIAAGTRMSMADAQSVARRAGAGRMIIGDVLKVGNRTAITATLVNASTGNTIRTARAETVVADSLIGIFGKLARQILAVPTTDANAGSAGTSSVGAFKEYVAGNQALNRFDAPVAKKHYEAALALDSNFALAHYKWAIAASYDQKAAAERQAQIRLTDLGNMARLLEDPERIAHAKSAARLSTNLPAREKALISGLVATVSYDYPRACDAFRGLVRADSSDVEALYGYGLCLVGDDMVLPVVEGDTSRMRFRTSWNEGLDMFRQAASVDPSFHLAFDAIVSILTSPVRSGCARRDVLETCADTAIHRRYIAPVERRADSLVTVPRAGYRSVLDVIIETQRSSPARANLELASRAAADWIALAPAEGRAHKHLATLLMRLGRTAEAERELIETMKDSVMRADQELYLRRLEIAFKLRRGAEANRLLDSMPIVNPSELGKGNAVIYGVTAGRARAGDSLYAILIRQQAGNAPAPLLLLAQQTNRIVAGLVSDSLGAMEQTLFSMPGFPPTCGTGCFRVLAANFTLALRAPRKWPAFAPSLDTVPALAPARALARNDTAALRRAAVVLDSMSRSLVAGARSEDGSTVIAAEAFLALHDSVSALRMAQRLTDSTLQQSGVEASLSLAGGPVMLLWPRAMLLRADLEAAKGDKDIARDYYTRFLALWAKADPEFAPLLQSVRTRLAALR